MTSWTHQIYNIIFEHGFNPPSPVWTMFKKTALFWKQGIPYYSRCSLFTFHSHFHLFNFTFFRRPFSRQPQTWRPWPDIPLGRSRQYSGSSALSLGSIMCSHLFWWIPACLSTCNLSLLRVYSLEDLEESRVDSLSSPDSTGSTFQKTKSKYFWQELTAKFALWILINRPSVAE